MRPEISTLGYLPLLYILVKPCPLLNVTLYFIQGKGAYLKRIGDSDWCFNSEVTARYPMQWYVDGKCVAGFANTMDKRSLCNAKFVSLKERVFLVSTKRIREGDEVMAYYKSVHPVDGFEGPSCCTNNLEQRIFLRLVY